MDKHKICDKCTAVNDCDLTKCGVCGASLPEIAFTKTKILSMQSAREAALQKRNRTIRLVYAVFYTLTFAALFITAIIFTQKFQIFLLLFYALGSAMFLLEALWLLKPAAAEKVFGFLAYFSMTQFERDISGSIKPNTFIIILVHFIIFLLSHGALALALIFGII